MQLMKELMAPQLKKLKEATDKCVENRLIVSENNFDRYMWAANLLMFLLTSFFMAVGKIGVGLSVVAALIAVLISSKGFIPFFSRFSDSKNLGGIRGQDRNDYNHNDE
jgi:hypothetical protein